MQSGENEEHKTKEDGWCPDYTNRQKEEKINGTLENWIKKTSMTQKDMQKKKPVTIVVDDPLSLMELMERGLAYTDMHYRDGGKMSKCCRGIANQLNSDKTK